MQLTMRQYVETSAGFRCVAATMKIMSGCFEVKGMSHTTVRRWLLCYGYYLLTCNKIKKDGYWALINDFSIQLGKEKCLLTLGVPIEQMRQHGFNLIHKDVEVLDIFVTTQASKQLVKSRLDVVKERTGIPAQIVSDHGSDIKTGNELFCQEYPGVVYTYDISHKIACLLKALLENDPIWKCLLKTINIVLQQVQQTELSFLRPIMPRKKARYLNISIIVNWVDNILSYMDKGDYSLVLSGYCIHPESIYQLTTSHPEKQTGQALMRLLKKKYENPENILDELSSILSKKIKKDDIRIIDLSEQRLTEKFGLFQDYRELIKDVSSMLDMLHGIQKAVKHRGLSAAIVREIEKNFKDHEFNGKKSELIYKQVLEYLKDEVSKFADPEKSYLASSDIEESLFGKYKYKLAERTGGIYSSVLILSVLSSNFEIEHIKAACEKYRLEDVDNFYKKMAGSSLQAKRRLAFSNCS
jgi:hypothetical protein